MRKILCSIFFSVLAMTAVAQPIEDGDEILAWQDLVFEDARVSLAGPNALYISNVIANDRNFSFVVRQDAEGAWKIAETYREDTIKVFPGQSFFDLANIQLQGNTLVIDGVYMEKELKRVEFTVLPDGSLSLDEAFTAGAVVGRSLERSRELGRIAYTLPGAGTEVVDGGEGSEDSPLTSDILAHVGDLESKNKALEDENASLELEVKDLLVSLDAEMKQVESLRAQVAEKDAAIASLEERNQTLVAEVDRLKAELAFFASGEVATDETVAAQAEVQVDSSVDLEALQTRIRELEAQVAVLEAELAGLKAADAVVETPQDLQELVLQVKDLTAKNEALMAQRADLEQELRRTWLTSGYIAIHRDLFTQTKLSGFAGGRSEIGRWTIEGGVLRQNDPSAYYARYTLPMEQKNKAVLYRFVVKTTASGWSGAGFHLYARNSPKSGYGHGESLLVWLTRDPLVHRTNQTHLQLYKSDDDVVMSRVLDAVVTDSMARDMAVEVLYEPADEYITIAVNGVEKIRYKTWFDVTQGVEIALRSLGTAEFRNLQVLEQE